jgi:hypothetical protein
MLLTTHYLLPKDVFSGSRSNSDTYLVYVVRHYMAYRAPPRRFWGVNIKQKGTYVKHRDPPIWSLWLMWVDSIMPLLRRTYLVYDGSKTRWSTAAAARTVWPSWLSTGVVSTVTNTYYLQSWIMNDELLQSLGPDGSSSICYDMQLLVTTDQCVWLALWFDNRTQL